MRREPSKHTRCRFGIATRDITPPVGIYNRAWGAAMHDTAEGVHRPLRATATLFAPLDAPTDAPPFALVALDLGWFSTEDETWFRSFVRGRASIPDAQFLLTLSHAHSTAVAATHLADRPGGDLVGAVPQSPSRKRVTLKPSPQPAPTSPPHGSVGATGYVHWRKAATTGTRKPGSTPAATTPRRPNRPTPRCSSGV